MGFTSSKVVFNSAYYILINRYLFLIPSKPIFILEKELPSSELISSSEGFKLYSIQIILKPCFSEHNYPEFPFFFTSRLFWSCPNLLQRNNDPLERNHLSLGGQLQEADSDQQGHQGRKCDGLHPGLRRLQVQP